mgnify:CR=1 FL=1
MSRSLSLSEIQQLRGKQRSFAMMRYQLQALWADEPVEWRNKIFASLDRKFSELIQAQEKQKQ